MTKEQIGVCGVCEDVSVPSTIGEDCDACGEGFYEECVAVECTRGDECTEDEHHFGLDVDIYLPEDVPDSVL